MTDTNITPTASPAQHVRLSLTMERSSHDAMATAALAARRSLTAEINVACDEHLARFSTTTNQPTTAKE